MSPANELSRIPIANGGFGDPELTPKPLRIHKREYHGTSTAGTVNSSLSLRKSQRDRNLKALAPSKKSSTQVNSTQMDLSLQFAAPTSQWAQRNTFLQVQKQRQSDTNTVALAAPAKEPIGSPFNPPASSRDSCPTVRQLGSSSDASKATPAARPASTRAFTIGTYRTANSLSPVHEISPSPSASSALRGDQRRAVTDAEAFCKNLDPFKSFPHHGLRKQRSGKTSLLSRMMSGLTNRTHVSHATSRGGIQYFSPALMDSYSSTATDGSAHQDAQDTFPAPQISNATSPTTAGSFDSYSSIEPKRFHVNHATSRGGNQYFLPALENSFSSTSTATDGSAHRDALNAFPTPPRSNATSPTTAGSPNSRNSVESKRFHVNHATSWGGNQYFPPALRESAHQDARDVFPTPPISDGTIPNSRNPIEPKRFRELCTPADAVLMGAELTLTPEYDHLSAKKGQSMLVSLDIKGTTNSTSIQDVWSQHTGLDVVVVLDNSLHTSPAALMASCETTRFLASILNAMTDRLAIICTSTTSGATSTVVRDLSQVKMHKIKITLDAITSSSETPKTNWIDTIDCAKEILLESMVLDLDEEPLQDTFGHIFLLTPDADGLPFQSLAHEKLTFHIISPAGVPRMDQSSIHCNGWILRSLSGNEPQAVSTKKDLDPTSVPNRLRDLIPQARSGKLLGYLTELVLEVSAGPDCTIEGVIGKVEFTKLHPGEIFTVLFELTVRPTPLQLSRTPTLSSEALLNTEDVLSQLAERFGPTAPKILTARLTYKHLLLPAGTTCSVTTECRLKRRLPDSDHIPSPPKTTPLQARDCTVFVQKRLAYHLATHGSPRTALAALRNEFGNGFNFSPCPDYVDLLAKELKYQARIVERLEIETSPKESSAVHATNSPDENLSQGLLDAEGCEPQRRAISDIPTEELFKAKPALAVLSLKESREQLRTDEARRIWGDLRKMKRPPNQVVKGRSVSSPLDEARGKYIRELAVRNKRSIGSDTLRSITSAGESMGKGLGAPWL